MHESEPLTESVRASRPPAEPFVDPDHTREPVREGLPPGFRMRADAHYVDQLDARSTSTPIRLIDTQTITQDHQHGEPLSPAFLDSIKRLGVLQPLIVTPDGSRYHVIAGRRRLAAAVAAGLRDVPCLVQRVDADQAERMALATNLPATRPRPVVQPSTGPDTPSIVADLTDVVSALVSCAELLASPSALTQMAASDLVRAEAARALDALVAVRVLRDEMPIARAPVAFQSILERLATAGALERQLRGIGLHVDASPEARGTLLKADVRLLTTGLVGLIAAAASLLESAGVGARVHADAFVASVVRLRCIRQPDAITLSVSQGSIELPTAWLARPFDIAWPIRGGATSLTQLRAARKIAQAHGGTLDVESADGGTAFVLSLPVSA